MNVRHYDFRDILVVRCTDVFALLPTMYTCIHVNIFAPPTCQQHSSIVSQELHESRTMQHLPGQMKRTPRIDALVTNRCIGRFGRPTHASGPSVDSRNLFLDRWSDVSFFFLFSFFFFSFFQPSHESRVSSTLRAISANNASALRNGINRGWHVNSDGIRDRSSRSTKEPKSVTWPMTIIVCQITRSISR